MRAIIAARKSNKVDSASGEGIGLDTQDEHSREFAERLGVEIVGVARDVISGRVAPIDRKSLGAWLTEPAKLALFDAVIAYKTDRLSRGDDVDWSRIETWAADNGKVLIIVDSMTGIRYPSRDDSDYWQWSSAKRQSGKEWQDIRERITRAQCRIMRDGAWVGRVPFGYRIAGERYGKTLVPSASADYVSAMFDRAIAGESLRTIAAWLTSEGVKTERGNAVWNEGVVKQIIGNPTYSGSHSRGCAKCGESHTLPVPALVDMATQSRAQAALRSRVRGDNGGGRPSANPAMLVPVCDSCGVPMYRIEAGSGKNRTAYYYCKTRTVGGARKGCGLMVRCERADLIADALLSADAEPETVVTVTYPAAALESEIERVRRSERQAFEADDMDAMMALRSERLGLEAELATTERELVKEIPTGRTIGDVWSELLPAERRPWMKRHGISIRLTSEGVKLMTPSGQVSTIGRLYSKP